MANTAIIDLAKPAGTDHALISVINSNMDKIDAEAGRQRGNFAGTYSTTSGYAVGDYCIYQGNLYRCTTAIGSSGENWTAGHWTSVKVGTELKGLSDQIAIQSVTFTPVTGVSASAVNIYRIGDLMIGSMYLKITDTTLLAVNKTLGTYSVTLANTDKLQGIGQGNRIGYFMNNGNKLTVDNNYALPDIGNYVWVVEVHGKISNS